MKRRGFLLLMSLLLMSVIAVLGIGYVTSRQRRYSAAARALILAQARALAQAGMEDARLKIERDASFPPQTSADQTNYSYSEAVNSTTGTVLGRYVVNINTTYAAAPYYTLRVQSEGLAGPNSNKPTGSFTISAEFDLSPLSAGNSRNPNQYRIVNWSEDVSSP